VNAWRPEGGYVILYQGQRSAIQSAVRRYAGDLPAAQVALSAGLVKLWQTNASEVKVLIVRVLDHSPGQKCFIVGPEKCLVAFLPFTLYFIKDDGDSDGDAFALK